MSRTLFRAACRCLWHVLIVEIALLFQSFLADATERRGAATDPRLLPPLAMPPYFPMTDCLQDVLATATWKNQEYLGASSHYFASPHKLTDATLAMTGPSLGPSLPSDDSRGGLWIIRPFTTWFSICHVVYVNMVYSIAEADSACGWVKFAQSAGQAGAARGGTTPNQSPAL